MGFFDEFQDSGSLPDKVKVEEKAVLVAQGTPFEILRVIYFPTGKFGDKEKNPTGAWYAVVINLDDEERSLFFNKGNVESRDRMLDEMVEYLKRDDAVSPVVYFEQKGQSIVLSAYKQEGE